MRRWRAVFRNELTSWPLALLASFGRRSLPLAKASRTSAFASRVLGDVAPVWAAFAMKTRARKHKCVPAWAVNNRKAKLKLLSKVRDWCRRHPELHTMPHDELNVIFTLAKLALQGRDIRMPV